MAKSYTARNNTIAVVQDWDNWIIGPENTQQWAEYQQWLSEGNTPNPAPPLLVDPQLVNAEGSRRVYLVASDNSQKNMTANYAAGNLSAADETAFKDGLTWVSVIQQTCRTLIANNDFDYQDDSKWAVAPPDFVDLAARY